MPTLAEVKKMKVAELKDELTALGLPTDGKKDALMARLEEALSAAPLVHQLVHGAQPARGVVLDQRGLPVPELSLIHI